MNEKKKTLLKEYLHFVPFVEDEQTLYNMVDPVSLVHLLLPIRKQMIDVITRPVGRTRKILPGIEGKQLQKI